MIETMCICCGAEIDRPWNLAVTVKQSMCIACAAEVEVAGHLIQLEELATLSY